MLRLWIRKDGLSGETNMIEGKRIYMESVLLNQVQEISFAVLLPGLP